MKQLKIASIIISDALLLCYVGSVMAWGQEDSTSWQPQGSDFIDNEDGSTSMQPQGNNFINNK